MPKQKSHGGISKKIKVRASGTTKINRQGGNHFTGKKSTSFNRKLRNKSTLSKGDAKRLKKVM